MSKGKQPWMKFFVGDWRTDPAVSLCTPAARGVWIDLLTAMHQAGCSGVPDHRSGRRNGA
jgi:hypothetical protein